MDNEVTKLYENAEVEKDWTSMPYGDIEEYYPEFTAEKQLSLIKWLAFKDYIAIVSYINGEYHSEHDKYNADENSLESCLAKLINNLWQDLTDKEKAEIKRILE